MTKVRLELLTDIDMPLFIEKGIRGGVEMIGHRYAKANNVYLSTYDSNLPREKQLNSSVGTKQLNSTGENNSTQQQERTTQLVSRNETTQLVSRNETAQLCTDVDRLRPPTTPTTAYNRLQPPATAYNRLQPPTTACNRLQPPTTACNAYNRLQPPTTACNRLQPPATACNRLQPPATACNRLQPPATACNRLQPPATACNRLHRLLQQNRLFLPTDIVLYTFLGRSEGRTSSPFSKEQVVPLAVVNGQGKAERLNVAVLTFELDKNKVIVSVFLASPRHSKRYVVFNMRL
ncbi:hypothetical protein TNCV_3023891 [Trichonephila clavipes]|nr:hypothetical protein TNCV_3023891 [Trichonephila clavipes]